MDRHFFSSFLCSFSFFLTAWTLPVQAIPYTTESVQSGVWSDLSRIENRIDFSTNSAIVSIQAFVANTHSAGQDCVWASGLSFEERSIGTRVVYGPLHAVGLPSRLTDPLGKTLPSGYGRLRSDYRLDTGASGSKSAAMFAAFSPQLPKKLELATGFVHEHESLSGIVTFGIINANDRRFRLDVFAEKALLPSRAAIAWFSVPPPLPRREQKLYAISTSAALPHFSATIDLAFSDQDYSGKGWHLGGTASARKESFLVDLAADYTTSGFTDTEGISRGAGLRAFLETRLKGPSASLSLGINAASYDSPTLEDTIKLKIAYIPSEAARKNNLETRPFMTFRVKSLTAETQVTEEDVGSWIPSFQFRLNNLMGKASLSEKVGFKLTPLTFALESFSCGVDATFPIQIRKRSEFRLAELKGSISMKTATADSPVFAGRLGMEWNVQGGWVNLSVGTDDSATAEKLLAALDNSGSAFGPWNVSLSWRFEERSPPPILVR